MVKKGKSQQKEGKSTDLDRRRRRSEREAVVKQQGFFASFVWRSKIGKMAAPVRKQLKWLVVEQSRLHDEPARKDARGCIWISTSERSGEDRSGPQGGTRRGARGSLAAIRRVSEGSSARPREASQSQRGLIASKDRAGMHAYRRKPRSNYSMPSLAGGSRVAEESLTRSQCKSGRGSVVKHEPSLTPHKRNTCQSRGHLFVWR